MLSSLLTRSLVVQLAAAFLVMPAVADEADSKLVDSGERQIKKLGCSSVLVYSVVTGAPGTITLEKPRDGGAHEAGRSNAKGVCVWGLLGWCTDCSQPIPDNSVFVNVGDQGTPVRIGSLVLEKGEFARFTRGRVAKIDAGALASGATQESRNGASNDANVPSHDKIEPPSIKELPAELTAWKPGSRTLMIVEIAVPQPMPSNLDQFRLECNGRSLARCCGVLVDADTDLRILGQLREIRTHKVQPVQGFRFAEQVEEATIRAGENHDQPHQLGASPRIVTANRAALAVERDTLRIEPAGTTYLLGSGGLVATVSQSASCRATLLLSESKRLALVFALNKPADGIINLRCLGKELGSVVASPGDDSEALDDELARLAGQDKVRPSPAPRGRAATDLPAFRGALPRGRNQLTIVNKSAATVRFGLRKDGRGANLLIPAKGSRTIRLADGRFSVYLRFESDNRLLQGDDIALANEASTLTINAGTNNYSFRAVP